MARIISYKAYQTGSEEKLDVFKSLQSQLTDDSIVLQSLRWTGFQRVEIKLNDRHYLCS
jgi:hypothetical protein